MIAPVRLADSLPAATTSSSIVSSSLGRVEAAEERRPAEMDEGAADVRLQQHDGGEHHVADDVANQPVEGLELSPCDR